MCAMEDSAFEPVEIQEITEAKLNKKKQLKKNVTISPLAVTDTCLLADVRCPDFGKRRDSSVLRTQHGDLGLTVNVEMRV